MSDPDGWREIDETQREEIARLRADAEHSFKRITQLEAALRPFADFYKPAMEVAGDGHVITQGSSLAQRQLTIGDVRRAYATLNG